MDPKPQRTHATCSEVVLDGTGAGASGAFSALEGSAGGADVTAAADSGLLVDADEEPAAVAAGAIAAACPHPVFCSPLAQALAEAEHVSA